MAQTPGPDLPAAVTPAWPTLVGGIAAGLTALALLLAGAAWWIRAVVRTETAPAREAAAQTATSNGNTLGQVAEATRAEVGGIKSEVEVLTGWAGESRDLAQKAARRASEAERRASQLDRRMGERLAAMEQRLDRLEAEMQRVSAAAPPAAP